MTIYAIFAKMQRGFFWKMETLKGVIVIRNT